MVSFGKACTYNRVKKIEVETDETRNQYRIKYEIEKRPENSYWSLVKTIRGNDGITWLDAGKTSKSQTSYEYLGRGTLREMKKLAAEVCK